MANTITNLVPDLYSALDVVSRELVGFIPSVSSDMTFERAAVGQTVRSPVAPAASAGDITPGVTPPDDGDQTIGNVSMTITKARRVPIRWNGEQSLGLDNNGPGRSTIMRDQFAQAMRTLCNEVEADIAATYAAASRAYGTAGTTPFASTLGDAAQVRKILADNGAPLGDLSLVMNTSAGAALRTLGQLSKANEAGTIALREQGTLLNIYGMNLRESAYVSSATAGTGASYVTNTGSTYAIGTTTIAVDTGSGTVLAGDVVTFAGDANKYVVTTALSGGSLTIAAPGLKQTLADGVAMTVVATSARNMAFARSAIALATRAPALPGEGDSADDRMVVTDERSGLSFEVAMYKQYRQVQYEVSLAWGVKAVKPEHMAILLG
jgi:hypothetical protein